MKARNFFIYGMVVLGFAVSSCDEKDDDIVENKFSTLTVEEHKANIEDDGLEMLDEIQAIENEPAIEANTTMVGLMDESIPFKTADITVGQLKSAIAFKPIYQSANLDKVGVEGLLKSTLVNPVEDPETIQELYDELTGTYEWSYDNYDWTYTEGGDAIVFIFPSEEGSSDNNATYTITYSGYTGPNPLQEVEDFDYEGDIPQNVAAVLTIDETEASRFQVDVVYDAEGYPTNVDVLFTVGTYAWNGNLSNSANASFDVSVSFEHADATLMSFEVGADGNWSQDNVEDNINTTYYGEWYDQETGWHYEEISESEMGNYDYTWTEEEVDIHKIVTNGNASFQAMNLKMVGEIDVKGLGTKIEEIDDTYDWDTEEEEAVNAEVDAANEFVNLTLRYVNTNEIVALVEAYLVEEDYNWEEYWYDEEWHDEPRIVTETDYWIDFRFVFADDSKVDFETYFSEGFDDLIDEVESWGEELEDTYYK